jgi:ribose/xylose/arabinose/galactoside ABC-type transport system permease subunit
MNRLFLSVGMVVFVAATFLLVSTTNTTTTYSCITSSGTNQSNSSSGVNGNLMKPNAFVGSGHIIAICSGMSHFSQNESTLAD